MGYDVHITRASDWLDSETTPISIDEWDAYIQSDPEMRRDDEATACVDGEPVLSCYRLGLAVWLAYSKNDPNEIMAWFDFRNGRVTVKNPDAEILAKMKRIAAELGANVIGDDGEDY